MDVRGSDAFGALRWGLRRYAWLFVACIVAVLGILPVLALRGAAVYEAEALVVAQRLDMDLVALPRYAEAVFDNGEVARAVFAEFGAAGDIEDIVPNRVSLVTEQDSIVVTVRGHGPSAATAADLANLAAQVFTGELNNPGEGVGAFAIQSEALPPSEPTERAPGLPFLVPVGLMAGAAIGLAAVVFVLIARRPVLEATDAEEVTGVPVLGKVTLPRLHKHEFPHPQDVRGIVPVCRRLTTMPSHSVIIVGSPHTETARGQIAVAMVGVLRLARSVEFVAAPELRAAVQSDDGAGSRLADLWDLESRAESVDDERTVAMVLIEGAHPLNLVGIPESSTTVLIVPEGISMRALRAAVMEHLGGGSAGLLLVRRSRRRPRFVKSPSDGRHVAVGGEGRERAIVRAQG